MVTKKKKIQRGGLRHFGQRSQKPVKNVPKVAPVNVAKSNERAKIIAENAAKAQTAKTLHNQDRVNATTVQNKAALFEKKINKPSRVAAPEVQKQGSSVALNPKNKTPVQAVAPTHNVLQTSAAVRVSADPHVAIRDVVGAKRIAAAVNNPMYRNKTISGDDYITVGNSNSTKNTSPDVGQRSNYLEVEPSIRPIQNQPKIVNPVANPLYSLYQPPNEVPPPRPPPSKPDALPLPNNAPQPPVTPQNNTYNTLVPPKPEQPQNNTYNTVLPPKPEQPPPLPPRNPLPPPLLPRVNRANKPQNLGPPPPRPPKPNLDNLTNDQLRDAANTGMDYLKNLIQYAPQNNQADLQLMLKDFLRQQKNLKISISQTQSQQPQTPQQSAERKKKIRGFFDKLWHNIKFISGDLKTESKELHHTTIERGEKLRALGRQLRAYSRQNTKKAMRNQRMSEMRSNLNSSNRPKTLRQTSTNERLEQVVTIGNNYS